LIWPGAPCRYQLVLPRGSSYSRLSGRVLKDTGVMVAGLRAFRLPVRTDFQMLKQADEQAWDAVRCVMHAPVNRLGDTTVLK